MIRMVRGRRGSLTASNTCAGRALLQARAFTPHAGWSDASGLPVIGIRSVTAAPRISVQRKPNTEHYGG